KGKGKPMAERPDRTLGPVEGMPYVEQTASIGGRVHRKKDSSGRRREKPRHSGGIEEAIEEEREQIEKGGGVQDGHVDYRA
ncbi:MAG TPA: hypothetical protein PK054_10215, partial [Anaerohalosphaeraceae bacterium]|nr:hypothetical protein [Anaerohalosphaeraceae bacterium]